MAKKKINVGDAQPVPCRICGMAGYSYCDLLTVSYTEIYYSDGSHEGGFYGDHYKAVKISTIANCSNCGAELDFKLIRKKHD